MDNVTERVPRADRHLGADIFRVRSNGGGVAYGESSAGDGERGCVVECRRGGRSWHRVPWLEPARQGPDEIRIAIQGDRLIGDRRAPRPKTP